MPMKHRNYKRERQLAKRRGETGVGSDSGDAKRHRARRAYIKKNGALPEGVDVDHKRTIKQGGSNKPSNLRARPSRANKAAGGRAGNRAQKGVRKP